VLSHLALVEQLYPNADFTPDEAGHPHFAISGCIVCSTSPIFSASASAVAAALM
jgi:hypothetical protein